MKAKIVAICLLMATACIQVSNESGGGLFGFDAGPPRTRPDSARRPPDAGPPGPGSFRVVVSGGDFPRAGFPFPPSDAGAPAFVDGWQLRIDHLLVMIGNIALWEDPDRSPSDPTQVGQQVALVRGPWVLDLRCLPGSGGNTDGGTGDGGVNDGGTTDGGMSDGGIDGSSSGQGDPLAIEIANILNQNLVSGNPPFDPTKRYAISFDIIPPQSNATQVNLCDGGETFLNQMNSNRYSVWYIGHADWRGSAPTCFSTDAGFDFTTINQPLDFSFGFRTPTTYVNCQNPLLPGPGIGSEPYPRGVIASPDTRTTIQLTLRPEQTFSEDYERADAPIHFDQFAAVGYSSFFGRSVQLEDAGYARFAVGLNYTAFPVPWRWCSPELTGYHPPDNNPWMDFRGQQGRSYNPNLAQNLCSATQYRDYYDLVSNIQSAQGYLNAQGGRCAIQRHFTCQQP